MLRALALLLAALPLAAQYPPVLPGAQEEVVLTDPFDYPAEDQLIDAWLGLRAKLPVVPFAKEPGIGLAYSGPGGRPRSRQTFDA